MLAFGVLVEPENPVSEAEFTHALLVFSLTDIATFTLGQGFLLGLNPTRGVRPSRSAVGTIPLALPELLFRHTPLSLPCFIRDDYRRRGVSDGRWGRKWGRSRRKVDQLS